MKNSIKTSLQNQEFDALKDSHRVILRWATGVGKSKMAIDLVNHAAAGYSGRKPKVVFIVAERSHIKNWEDEFNKWGLDRQKMNISLLCYASLHKLKDMSIDILVLDEAHHSFTEKRMNVLESIQANYVYLLSATLSIQKTIAIEEIYGKFTTSTVTLKEAIRQDILPDPKVILIGMELDNLIPNQEIKVGNTYNPPVIQWKDRSRYIYRNAPCIIKCTAQQKYNFFTEKMEYWKRRYESSHNQFHHNLWVSTGSLRKRYLGELKTRYVHSLVSSFPKDKRYICFCASVPQANWLDAEGAISSKKSSKVNQQIIDAFNNKEINKLYVVGMANEGLNLVDIHAGVIVQLDGKERLFIQKVGRVVRADTPVVYIFYYKGTQDEVYLKSALENIDSKFIKQCNVNDLWKIQQMKSGNQ